MNQTEVLFCWNYFRSLCDMLKNTMQFVDHSNPNNIKTNSYEFQKIIMLASMEFENISKQLCLLIDSKYRVDEFNIKDITRIIVRGYPEIRTVMIKSDFTESIPLREWKLDINGRGKEQVYGLDWWKKYNSIKHNAFKNYKDATLKNARDALASLMVLEIIFVKAKAKNSNIMNNKPCSYFINPYQNELLFV